MRVPHAQTALALRCGRAAAMANQAPSVTFRSSAVLFFLVVYSHPRSVWLRPFSSAYSCSQDILLSGFGELMCTRGGLTPEATVEMTAADAICPEKSGQSCQPDGKIALNMAPQLKNCTGSATYTQSGTRTHISRIQARSSMPVVGLTEMHAYMAYMTTYI